jgi:ATP-dependent DNA ligase
MSPFLWDDLDLPEGSRITEVLHDTVTVSIPADKVDEYVADVMSKKAIDFDFELKTICLDDSHEGTFETYAPIKAGPVVVKRPREGIQLCQVYKPAKPPAWDLVCFEPKRNGNRCRIEIHDGKAVLLSSTGLPHWNVQHIIDELETSAMKWPDVCGNVMLDGELMHDTLDFDTASGMLRNHTVDERASGFFVHVWDAMPIADFDARKCDLTLAQRKELMEVILDYLWLDAPEHHVTKNPYFIGKIDEVLTYAKQFVIEMGEEGIVMKNMAALYGFSVNGSKANSWLKWKPKFLEDGLIQNMLDGDMRVIGALEGKGKNRGMLGNLTIEGYLCDDGNIAPDRDANSVLGGQYIKTDVGSGPSNPQRKEMWKWHQEGTLVGRVVEVKYENVTKNNSLHHPIFYRMREDKN